jgi:hypothetical protein
VDTSSLKGSRVILCGPNVAIDVIQTQIRTLRMSSTPSTSFVSNKGHGERLVEPSVVLLVDSHVLKLPSKNLLGVASEVNFRSN